MLILTRRISESVKIGDDVTVTIVELKGRQVRLGVSAPKRIAVHREEVYERVRRQGEASLRSKEADQAVVAAE